MKTTTNHSHRIGFTLIEMLVVIAIIATLAGFLFPAIGKSLRTAKRNTAAIEAKSIAGAILLFYNDYGYMPVEAGKQGFTPGPGSGDYGDEQVESNQGFSDANSQNIIQVLLGDNKDLNPKGTSYLDVNTPTSTGEFLDPWGNQYWMKMDVDYDGKIQFFSNNKQYNKRAIVFSRGQDGELNPHEDNIASVLVDFTLE